MSKIVIVLSDGTGQAAASIWRTNVFRLFESIDLSDPRRQVAFYDDGIGTSRLKPFALFAGMFGYGLKRNVITCYKFLCRNYEPKADIFAFGFSRGAFTVRVLAGLVLDQGLVAYNDNEAELHRLAMAAYRAYRKKNYSTVFRVEVPFRMFRDFILRTPYTKVSQLDRPLIRFIGVWDTVAAYGFPVAEMTRFVSRVLLPLELPDSILHEKVRRACHALSLDDDRTTFHPVLWTEKDEKAVEPAEDGCTYTYRERISQVWFPGVHSNVGGGYPDDSMSRVSLVWMMNEARHCGLKFKEASTYEPDALRYARSAADKDGRLYNPRSGIGASYRYGPRNVFELCHSVNYLAQKQNVEIEVPKIHHTVFERIGDGVHPYAPIGIPRVYAVVDENGKILRGDNPYETTSQAQARYQLQERIWDLVGRRRFGYLGIIGASLYLLLYPIFVVTHPLDEYVTAWRLISDLIRFAGPVLPDFWVNQYARTPVWFLIGAVSLAYFIWLTRRLRTKISDEMLAIWRGSLRGGLEERYIYSSFEHRLRTNKLVNLIRWALLSYVIPATVTLGVIYFLFVIASRLTSSVLDNAGFYCRETSEAEILLPGQEKTVLFETRSICAPTGIRLDFGGTYLITMKQLTPWMKEGQPTSLGGFHLSQVRDPPQRVLLAFALPLRRSLLRPWSQVIMRVGAIGGYELFLDPEPPPAPQDIISERFRPQRTGELFLYLNDAILPIPGVADIFYRYNAGSAEVRVRRL
jgi:uncharacterized protein (DUF2235 family)